MAKLTTPTKNTVYPKDLIVAALELGQKHLIKLENEIIIEVLYDLLPLVEIGKKRQLTGFRVKQIYEGASRKIVRGNG